MRPPALRVLLSVPVLIVLGLAGEARAGNRSWGFGVGVGYGYGAGPYWGVLPFYYNGFYGNGLSMYGPPVPTGKPIPGVFGGGDSQFFDPIPPAYLYPGWVGGGWVPLAKPGPLPAAVVEAPPEVPPPVAALAKPAPLEVEVHVPRADARLYIDGAESKSTGVVRKFATPPSDSTAAYTYELRAEWSVDGRTTTHTKRVTGRAGERVVVEFQ
jgi:uncharacterized protein (TIGR03000 family)